MLISLCINMSNMVLEQVVHRMYILLCFLLLVTGFYPVWFGTRGTDAKTGWPALRPANAVLFHLLAVERMLYEKTIATKT
jgi:hypothetical protein